MKKRKLAALGISVAAAGSMAAGIYFYRQSGQEPQGQPEMPEDISFLEDAVSSSGLTGVGMSEEIYELGFLEDGLYIEETYLNTGDEVDAKAAVFQVSEESLEDARNELEKAVTQAGLESRKGRIAYETGMEDAENAKNLAQIEAAWAQSVYDNAVAEAQEALESVQEDVDEAQEKVDEYTASVQEDFYDTYYKVGELEAEWKDYAAFLQQLYTEWDVDGLESVFGGSGGKNGIGYVTNRVSSSSLAAGTSSASSDASAQSGQEEGTGGAAMAGMGASAGSDEIKYNIYLAMEEEAEECEAAYEEALEQYEDAKETAQAGLEKAKSELAVLQAKLTRQQTSYEKALIEAQTAYDLAMTNSENAQLVYEAAVKQLEEEYQTLLDEEETARQRLELFENTVGDGTFYTQEAGTVMMTNVRAGSWLTEDSVVLAYTDPDTVTVSASVSQEDIDRITIGEEAFIVISGYGTYSGTVTGFDPMAASSGSTSVAYTVTVKLEGDVSGLESNLTAYVYFGLTEEEKEMLTEGGEQQMSENSAPEGMEMPGDAAMSGQEKGGAQ